MVFGLSVRASEVPSCSLVHLKRNQHSEVHPYGCWILGTPRDDREKNITSPYLSQDTPIWSFSAKRTTSNKRINTGLFTFAFCWLSCWCLCFQAFFSKRLESSFLSLFLFMTRLILQIPLQSLHFRAAERTSSILLCHPRPLGATG